MDQGEITAQPMVTKTGRANRFDLYHLAPELAWQLQTAGFPVIRTKIEIPAESELVPQTTGETRKNGRAQYFEHHLKLVLAPGTNLGDLMQLVKSHSAHLSRNALQVRPDRREERFVTQRCFGVTREDARQQLGSLLQEIEQLEFRVIKTEAEYVLFDSNLALDAGWIQGKG